MIEKMTFVEIYRMILPPEERSTQLPNDTQRVPFDMRIRGRLLHSAHIGDVVEILTATGRKEKGIMIAENPHFFHNYGRYLPIFSTIRDTILKETEDIL